MQFGEYLKNRRTELGWTQPDAATKAGIEQSYLSKLETGKSFPSQEVYQRLVTALTLDTEALVAAVEPAELDRLSDIAAVRQHLLQREHGMRSTTRRWLYAGLAALVAGGALIGLAQIDRGGAATHYTYQSSGVILPGESLDVFGGVDDTPAPSEPDYADRLATRDALIARIDEQTISIPDMRGPSFTESLPQGRRIWALVGANAVLVPARFGWGLVPGFALIIGGLGCFFISWRRP
ncbi:helix-turn-helix transcriptional regulator [Terricaulis sp.]|uniref:helix-turn-helix domain-containing protein n=1 Tax=Terricaulis sp. TaxID=2768686 RepID=UPI002AC43A28|nr:helix-turn-helix transcriptional regulator [Terricaulis sp.]MDZ4689881.1 helix-turn-helix transcriptional regulator [Terricaulis sp.]